MNKKTLLACTTAMAALGAMPAYAQDSSDIIVTAQRNNQTEVTAGGDLGVFGEKKAEDIPFQIRSYNEALILNQQPQTLGQVLENDPTIRTSYGFGNASEQFVIRGFPLFGDDVGLNGLYGIAPRQLVAPELFQSVQVLNGASAFINGAAPGGSSVGGSVNLQLKRASADLTRATLGYTSDSHFGGSVDVARRFGDNGEFGLRVNGAFRSGDVSIDNEFRRTTVIGGAFDWDGGNVRISVDAAYQKVEVDQLRHKVTLGFGVNSIPKPPKQEHNFAQPWTYSDMRDIFGVARLEYDVADNALFYLTGGARDGSEKGIYGGITVNDPITGDATGDGLLVPRTDNNEAVEAGFRVKLGSQVTQEINFGTNMVWQTNRNAYDFLYNGPSFAGFPTNLYDTVDVPLPTSSLVGGDLDNPFPIAKNRLWSVFASDTVGFWNDRILLTGGLRLQSINVKSFSYFDGSLASVYDKDVITPVVGLVVKPTDGVSLYANRIEALQQGPTAPLDASLVNPGEVFAPITSTQYEIGGKVTFGKFDASVALFQIELPTAFARPVNATQSVFGMFGEQRNRGVEFSLAAEPTDGLRVIGGFSVIDAKLRKTGDVALDGNKVRGVPDFTANANVEWDLPFVQGLTLTGRVVYTGEQPVNPENTLTLDDWWRLDLGARYVLLAGDKPVTLRAGVDNVTNERYWASAFDVFENALLQGNPRTFKASVSIDF
jgi:iron complex outermembrane receptor protein